MFERILGLTIAVCLVNTHDYGPASNSPPKIYEDKKEVILGPKKSKLDFSEFDKNRFDYDYDQEYCYG